MITFSTSYLPSIAHFSLIQNHPEHYIDGKEHFIKQSQRNRTVIYAANGPLSLSIPLQKYSNHSLTEDIKISYAEDWQTLHWRSFESAYRNTAYFEFYEDDLRPYYRSKEYETLMEFNAVLEKELTEMLGLESKPKATTEYTDQDPDWRMLLSPKNKELKQRSYFPAYQQVFSDQYGFQANLSVIDLLFNLGPHSINYLKEVQLFQ